MSPTSTGGTSIFGPLDSFSGRLWFKPSDTWELQGSIGRLKDPEQLEPGAIVAHQTSFFDASDLSHSWGIFTQPLAFLLFLTAAIAETKRTPFDIPEGEP